MAKTILFRFCLLSSFLIAAASKPVIGNQSLTCTDNGPTIAQLCGPTPTVLSGTLHREFPTDRKAVRRVFVRLSGGVASIDATAQARRKGIR